MLNITNHQVNADPKKKKKRYITSHLTEWLSSESQEITSAGEGVEKREP